MMQAFPFTLPPCVCFSVIRRRWQQLHLRHQCAVRSLCARPSVNVSLPSVFSSCTLHGYSRVTLVEINATPPLSLCSSHQPQQGPIYIHRAFFYY